MCVNCDTGTQEVLGQILLETPGVRVVGQLVCGVRGGRGRINQPQELGLTFFALGTDWAVLPRDQDGTLQETGDKSNAPLGIGPQELTHVCPVSFVFLESVFCLTLARS